MQTVDAVRKQLKSFVRPLTQSETVPLISAFGRVLAEDLVAKLQVPPHNNSAMDGYALRVIDGGKNLAVSQRIPAGSVPQALQAGTAARIFTGAPIPDGADSVIEQESVSIDEHGKISAQRDLLLGQHIRLAGEDIDFGQQVIAAGKVLSAADIGLAASLGVANLTVKRRLRIAVFFTGDELVEPGNPLGAGKIYNSNRYWLVLKLSALGFDVQDLGIIPDDFAATCATLRNASINSDVVITCGGVSVGEEDHVKAAVQAVGELTMWKIAMKPGKPLAYGRIGESDFIGLPGNPVSSFVVFEILIIQFLRLRSGAKLQFNSPAMLVRSMFEWNKADPNREEYLRARRIEIDGEYYLQNYVNQGSGVLTSCAWADGLVKLYPKQTVAKGDWLEFLPLSN